MNPDDNGVILAVRTIEAEDEQSSVESAQSRFIESRSELLNSSLGIIPSDDFEDCVQYICGSSETLLADALGRGRPELNRITKKLSRLGRKHTNHIDRLPRLWAFHVPLSSSAITKTQLPSASNDSSSSSSSSDAEVYGSSETVSLHEDYVELHDTVPDTSITAIHKRWRSFRSVSDSVQLESERTRRSLLSSVLCAIPDLPPDWLEPPPSTLPSSVCAHTLPAPTAPFPDVIPSVFATSDCGETPINQNFEDHNIHANYLGRIPEIVDPFRPTRRFARWGWPSKCAGHQELTNDGN
ncbi:unnamed protein product [Dicrocoelium dendriticum]|nr:unnamed protein product [Dicrocoelium dendriticum]